MLEETHIEGKRGLFFICKCDCGNIKTIYKGNVLKGATRSCGCLEKESRYNREHSKLKPNQKFGYLTLIEDSGQRSNNHSIIWRCLCDCGNEALVSTGNLISGHTKSCGCHRHDANTPDLIGSKFGKLTVIRKTDERTNGGEVLWECKCDCGNYTKVAGYSLSRGLTLSCGCLKSIQENYIAELLDKYEIRYTRQKRFGDCRNIKPLPFDFYLDNLNILIEYDGGQHYFPVQRFGGQEHFEKCKMNDSIKDKYCEDNNIQLIRIPYWTSNEEIDNIIQNIKSRNE